MIQLFSLLLVQTSMQQKPSWAINEPAWVVELLRAAPPSPPSWYEKSAIRRADGAVILPLGTVILDPLKSVTLPPNAPPDPFTAMNQRALGAMDRGDYEVAYREEESGHDAFELLGPRDLLLDAALLTGRYSEAESLLVQHLRLHPGGMTSYEIGLSLAIAMRGKVYAGQGAYVLDEVRQKARRYPEEVHLVGKLREPTTSTDVAFLSVLALGYAHDEPAYYEWALRLDPRCQLAGSHLVDIYRWRRRDADAARVAAGMVKSLPAGPDRDGFARMLKRIQKRIAASPTSTATGGG